MSRVGDYGLIRDPNICYIYIIYLLRLSLGYQVKSIQYNIIQHNIINRI